MQMNKLKEVTLIHRRKYCGFLAQLARLAIIDKTLYETLNPKVQQYFPEMQHTAGTAMLVPEDFQTFIQKPMRSFIQIDTTFVDGGITDLSGGQADYTQTDSNYAQARQEYDAGAAQLRKYSTPPPPVPNYGPPVGGFPAPPPPFTAPPPAPSGGPPPAENGGAGGGLTCRALYDYASDEASDLSFYANEIINVIQQDDDDSGWWEGEVNGRQGLFPKSYVEQL